MSRIIRIITTFALLEKHHKQDRNHSTKTESAFQTQSLALGIEANKFSPIFLISNFLILPLPVIGI
jgi:hypothetical protein